MSMQRMLHNSIPISPRPFKHSRYVRQYYCMYSSRIVVAAVVKKMTTVAVLVVKLHSHSDFWHSCQLQYDLYSTVHYTYIHSMTGTRKDPWGTVYTVYVHAHITRHYCTVMRLGSTRIYISVTVQCIVCGVLNVATRAQQWPDEITLLWARSNVCSTYWSSNPSPTPNVSIRQHYGGWERRVTQWQTFLVNSVCRQQW
jgi:hypothetical protein